MAGKSIGEDRMLYKGTAHPAIDVIRLKTAELINLCDAIAVSSEDGEVRRLAAIAMTNYEQAAMWAVKTASRA